MDTVTLKVLLKKNLCNCKYKSYVLAKNQVYEIDYNNLPAFVICNSQPINIKFGHWICFIIWNNEWAESFCSYGNKLDYYGININAKNVIDNSKSFQSEYTLVCGIYCLMYLNLRANHYPVNYFYSLFSTDRLRNDRTVLQFYNRIKSKKIICAGQKCVSKKENLKKK